MGILNNVISGLFCIVKKVQKIPYLELFWEKKAAEDCCEYVGCGSAVLFHNIVQPSGYK